MKSQGKEETSISLSQKATYSFIIWKKGHFGFDKFQASKADVLRLREREREGDMGRAPCCDKANVKKGPWSPEEDAKLKEYIEKYGTGGNWISLPQKAGNY